MFSVLSQTWDKEKVPSLHEESNLRTLDSALWCSTTDPQRLYGEWGLSWRGLSWSSFLDSLWGLSIVSLLQTRQKHLSLVRWKFKRGQLFAALHRFENSSNIDAAIQIFLHLPMSRFDSQSFYNICIVRRWSYVSRVFSYLHLKTW